MIVCCFYWASEINIELQTRDRDADRRRSEENICEAKSYNSSVLTPACLYRLSRNICYIGSCTIQWSLARFDTLQKNHPQKLSNYADVHVFSLDVQILRDCDLHPLNMFATWQEMVLFCGAIKWGLPLFHKSQLPQEQETLEMYAPSTSWILSKLRNH